MKKLLCALLAAVMILAMAACGKDESKAAYEQAVAAYNSGDYEAAYTMLTALGDYQDAAQMLDTITAQKVSALVETPDGNSHQIAYTMKNGNVVKQEITYADGTVVKNYYKYNDDGLCTSEILGQADDTKVNVNHFYDGTTLVRTIRTNPGGMRDTYEYTCDASGKVVSHVLTFADNSKQEGVYSYDEAGRLQTLTCTGADAQTIQYEYNEFGDLIRETVSADGETSFTTAITYTYAFSVAE